MLAIWLAGVAAWGARSGGWPPRCSPAGPLPDAAAARPRPCTHALPSASPSSPTPRALRELGAPSWMTYYLTAWKPCRIGSTRSSASGTGGCSLSPPPGRFANLLQAAATRRSSFARTTRPSAAARVEPRFRHVERLEGAPRRVGTLDPAALLGLELGRRVRAPSPIARPAAPLPRRGRRGPRRHVHDGVLRLLVRGRAGRRRPAPARLQRDDRPLPDRRRSVDRAAGRPTPPGNSQGRRARAAARSGRYGRLKARERNAAISPRELVLAGQNLFAAQPDVISSRESSSIQAASRRSSARP